MNQAYSYLIFRINSSLYGISTLAVKEIFLLPKLTPIVEAPPGIVGVVDVRGQVLPIMDLNLRFGQRTYDYALSNQVIVLEQGAKNLGVIADEVREVRDIPEADAIAQLEGDKSSPGSSDRFTTNVVRSQDNILAIVNLANLFNYALSSSDRASPESHQLPPSESSLPSESQQSTLNSQLVVQGGEQIALSSLSSHTADLTSEALTVLRERAERLKQIDKIRQNSDNVKNLAIVVLNREFFGVALENVIEFTNIEEVTPVPCCPPHIVGNMNLRGEILTVVDICRVLNLPPINLSKIQQLMVVEVDNLRVGLAIEKVQDTITIDEEEIDLVPAASYSTHTEYFQGTLSYQQNIVSILDISHILNSNLIVDQSG